MSFRKTFGIVQKTSAARASRAPGHAPLGTQEALVRSSPAVCCWLATVRRRRRCHSSEGTAGGCMCQMYCSRVTYGLR